MTLDKDTIYKVHVSPVSHFYAVIEPTNATGWYKYHTQKRARLAHPNLNHMTTLPERDFLALLHDRSHPVVLNEGAPVASAEEGDEETLYLVCMNCGEAFEIDEPKVALNHWFKICDKDLQNYDSPSFEILPESEAF